MLKLQLNFRFRQKHIEIRVIGKPGDGGWISSSVAFILIYYYIANAGGLHPDRECHFFGWDEYSMPHSAMQSQTLDLRAGHVPHILEDSRDQKITYMLRLHSIRLQGVAPFGISVVPIGWRGQLVPYICGTPCLGLRCCPRSPQPCWHSSAQQ